MQIVHQESTRIEILSISLQKKSTKNLALYPGSPCFKHTQDSGQKVNVTLFPPGIAFWSLWTGAHELQRCTSWVLFVVCCSITEKQSSIAKCHLWNLLSTFALLHVGLLLLDSCRVCSPLLEACESLRNKYYPLCLEGCNCIME